STNFVKLFIDMNVTMEELCRHRSSSYDLIRSHLRRFRWRFRVLIRQKSSPSLYSPISPQKAK
ncbi:7064_t:CDS:1, partial [Racocetra persica]